MFLASLIGGRPLIGRLADDFWPVTPEMHQNPPITSLFRGLTILWAGVNLAIATITLVLLLWLPLHVFVFAKQLSGWAITFSAIALTIVWSHRTAAARVSCSTPVGRRSDRGSAGTEPGEPLDGLVEHLGALAEREPHEVASPVGRVVVEHRCSGPPTTPHRSGSARQNASAVVVAERADVDGDEVRALRHGTPSKPAARSPAQSGRAWPAGRRASSAKYASGRPRPTAIAGWNGRAVDVGEELLGRAHRRHQLGAGRMTQPIFQPVKRTSCPPTDGERALGHARERRDRDVLARRTRGARTPRR